MNRDTVQKQIVANYYHFHGLVATAYSYASQGLFNEAVGVTKFAAEFAWWNNTGYMASRELEALLLEIGQRILPPSADPAPLQKPLGERLNILHVLTTGYKAGGHTRLVWQWITLDKRNQHSVILTNQGDHRQNLIPDQLINAPQNSGGQFVEIPECAGNYLEKARRLRQAAEEYDLIVLHQHPSDPIPMLALATLGAHIPILYLNHAPHVFWLGVSVTNLAVNLMKGFVKFCVDRRGIAPENCSLISIPIEQTKPARSRAEIRAELGISDEAILLFSSGTPHKYAPVDDVDFRDFVRETLLSRPHCHLVVAGPEASSPYWAALEEDAPGKIHLLGLLDEAAHTNYCAASDIHLNSMPFDSGTAVMEAMLLGLPALCHLPPERAEALTGFEYDIFPNFLYSVADKAAYIARLNRLVDEPSTRAYYAQAAKGYIERFTRGFLWEEVVADTYKKAFTTTRHKPSVLYAKATEFDEFFCALGMSSQASKNAPLPWDQGISIDETLRTFELTPPAEFLSPLSPADRAYLHSQTLRSEGGVDARDYQARVKNLWKKRPLFEFLLILPPGGDALLADTLDTIAGQYYDGWRLSIFAQSASPSSEFLNPLSQIRWIMLDSASLDTPSTLASAINNQVLASKADWFGFYQCGTQFAPELLLNLGDYMALHPSWSVIYTDEDAIEGKLFDQEKLSQPLFKPDFNQELFRSSDYIGDFWLSSEMFLDAGGFSSIQGAENYDLLLRAMDNVALKEPQKPCFTDAIGHIPEVLVHVPASVLHRAENAGAVTALADHLNRRRIHAEILPGLLPSLTRRLLYQHSSLPTVSIIIPTKNRLDLLAPCLDSLQKQTNYPHWELLIVDNGSTDADVFGYYAELTQALPGRVKLLSYPGEFNYAAMNNVAAQEATGDYLLLLNNDTVCIHEEWLEALMAHAQRPDVGIVGARLLYPDSLTIQHAGVVLGMNETAEHIFCTMPHQQFGYMNRAMVDQEYSAVTGACLLIRKSIFLEVGGLDAIEFKINCNDIDLCLRVRELGYRIIFTPFATLYHHGSSSVKTVPNKEKDAVVRQDLDNFYARWSKVLPNDPAWNRNLSFRLSLPMPETELVSAWNPDIHDRPRILALRTSNQVIGDYRQLSPLRGLHAQARVHYTATCEAKVGVSDYAPSCVEILRMAPETLFMHSPIDDARCLALMKYQRLKLPTFRVYSLDDLIDGLPDHHPAIKLLPPAVIGERVALGLSASHRLIVTNETLAHTYRHLIDDIHIIPNSLDPVLWGGLTSKRRQSKKLRVGWAGACQHTADLRLILEVVKATHTEVDWVFFGMRPDGAESLNIEYHEFIRDFRRYPSKLASLNLDLAVAPLEIQAFNEAKSNLRLLEYGINGWPVICTDIIPYQTNHPPVTRLPNQPEQWINAIRERINEPEALAKEGDTLKAWVQKNHLLEQHLDTWFNALVP